MREDVKVNLTRHFFEIICDSENNEEQEIKGKTEQKLVPNLKPIKPLPESGIPGDKWMLCGLVKAEKLGIRICFFAQRRIPFGKRGIETTHREIILLPAAVQRQGRLKNEIQKVCM